jgi:hypothetical protein
MDEAPFAATVARLALAAPDCADREALEQLLVSAGRPPAEWDDALADFARSPSVEAWDELHRFTPPDVYYDRVRDALRVLRSLGVDPGLLFQLATHRGTVPDAIEDTWHGTGGGRARLARKLANSALSVRRTSQKSALRPTRGVARALLYLET